MTSTRDWWSAYAIIVFFQLLTNGWLTGRGIVRYYPDTILGSGRIVLVGDGRLVYAPVEDLVFGFGLVLMQLRGLDVARPRAGLRAEEARMSVSTRLQAMQPTDIGVPGPTSLDMARAFRSVRADPLTFLGAGRRSSYGDLVSFPVPGAARAAPQRPRRRAPRPADLGTQLGQGHGAVRRPRRG